MGERIPEGMQSVAPCRKENCRFFGSWGVRYWEPKIGKKLKWYQFKDESTPEWTIFGKECCQFCEHFKGFNFYKKEV